MRVFISYHTPDSNKAEALIAAIEKKAAGARVVAAHRDPRHGANWRPELGRAIAEADAFLILVGEKAGRWQLAEVCAAHDRLAAEPSFPLVTVFTAEHAASLPYLGAAPLLVEAEPAHEPALSWIVAALKGKTAQTLGELWRSVNPYRGLESLKVEDADYFFGRDAETKAVLDLLQSGGGGENRIVTLIGNSGAGKSSIVEAGVFAALRRQRMPGGGEWPDALFGSREWANITMRPGEDPFAALVTAFFGLWYGDNISDPELFERRNKWIARLKDGRGLIADLLHATQKRFEQELGLAAPRRVLLNIDQSEELYSLTPEPLREPFSRLLVKSLGDPRLRVLASLCSDSYGHLQANATLYKRSARIEVLPFDAQGLKTAIAEPARVLGARLEPSLADFIASRAAKQADALPLLVFWMRVLWRRMQARGDGALRLDAKSEIADLAGALSAEADRRLAAHHADQDAMKRLLTQKLTLVQSEGKPLPRRVPLTALDLAETRLVEALADAGLAVTGGDANGGFAEIAHEALLHGWRTLASWLDTERKFGDGAARGAPRRWRFLRFAAAAILFAVVGAAAVWQWRAMDRQSARAPVAKAAAALPREDGKAKAEPSEKAADPAAPLPAGRDDPRRAGAYAWLGLWEAEFAKGVTELEKAGLIPPPAAPVRAAQQEPEAVKKRK
jgi:hypothetical protein